MPSEEKAPTSSVFDTRVRAKSQDEQLRAAAAKQFVEEWEESQSVPPSESQRQELLREAFNDGPDAVRARLEKEASSSGGSHPRKRRGSKSDDSAAES